MILAKTVRLLSRRAKDAQSADVSWKQRHGSRARKKTCVP